MNFVDPASKTLSRCRVGVSTDPLTFMLSSLDCLGRKTLELRSAVFPVQASPVAETHNRQSALRAVSAAVAAVPLFSALSIDRTNSSRC